MQKHLKTASVFIQTSSSKAQLHTPHIVWINMGISDLFVCFL